jgi:hypothetical protein
MNLVETVVANGKIVVGDGGIQAGRTFETAPA